MGSGPRTVGRGLVVGARPAHVALEKVDRTGQPVTFPAVARAVGVSRRWLYNQPELCRTIIGLRAGSTLATTPVPTAQRATPDSIHHRLDAARDEIGRLRTENSALSDQLARSFGDQRAPR